MKSDGGRVVINFHWGVVMMLDVKGLFSIVFFKKGKLVDDDEVSDIRKKIDSGELFIALGDRTINNHYFKTVYTFEIEAIETAYKLYTIDELY